VDRQPSHVLPARGRVAAGLSVELGQNGIDVGVVVLEDDAHAYRVPL
jgi:hypothetical protein